MRTRNKYIALLLSLASAVIVVLAILYWNSPRERVILLPQPDGTSSAVVVQSNTGATAVLDRPYSVATITPKRIGSEQTDAGAVNTRYRELFDALPPRPRSYVLNFETGGTRLTPESEKFLQIVLGVLRDIKDSPGFEITVIGHADDVGTDALNDELSRKRASTILSLLKSKGIDTSHASIVGRGSRDPLVSSGKGVAQVRNRRAEIRLK